jgi:hypothetical protein
MCNNLVRLSIGLGSKDLKLLVSKVDRVLARDRNSLRGEKGFVIRSPPWAEQSQLRCAK